MPSKVVASLSVVNLVLWTVVLSASCASSTHEADSYVEDARKAQDAERIAEARTLAEMALETGRHEGEAREILAEISRARAVEMSEAGDHLRAHAAYLNAADYEPSRPRRGVDLVDAMGAAERAGFSRQDQLDLGARALLDLPHDHDLHRNIARIAEDAGDDQLAAERYLWLFSADPGDTHAGLRLGIIYLAMEQPADAASILKRVYAAEPQNVQAAINLAGAFATLRYDEEAIELYEDLLERFPDHPAVLRHYAEFEKQRGEHNRARQLRDKATESAPSIEQREMRPLR